LNRFICAFTICTCRICTSWSLFHLILPYISVALPLCPSVISSSLMSFPRLISLVSVNPWTVSSRQLYRYCCLTLLSLFSPCFTNPFTPSTQLFPSLPQLSRTRFSSFPLVSVLAVYPALFPVAFLVNTLEGRFSFCLFVCFLFFLSFPSDRFSAGVRSSSPLWHP